MAETPVKDAAPELDDFFYSAQAPLKTLNEKCEFRYLTSRSTEESVASIEAVCRAIATECRRCGIPIKGDLAGTANRSAKLFKGLVCNTSLECQTLLSEDIVNGYLVDMLPPFSPYLLVEIVWHIGYEDVMAECLLHFPLDLCVEILETLPRCLDLLDFRRACKFLSSIVVNVYKKLILSRDNGTQATNIVDAARKLVGHLEELIVQFNSDRLLKLDGVATAEHDKMFGILLKTIIRTVRTCFTSKQKEIVLSSEMQKICKLTYGWQSLQKLDDALLSELLAEIDGELMKLLLKHVKDVDCNIYMNWTEYHDEDNTSLILQRAIGLEVHFFIENTKNFRDLNLPEYNHLIECLEQIASKPDPNNMGESLLLDDLREGTRNGNCQCLTALFQRYKEWDDSVIKDVCGSIDILSKRDCVHLFQYLVTELNESDEQSDPKKLQSYFDCLVKSVASLKITDVYELTLELILKLDESNNLHRFINIKNFERFIFLHPNFTNARDLRVVLLYLCVNANATLKILMKMAIGHSDYPDVAVSLDDLETLRPIMQIQMPNKCRDLEKCSNEYDEPRKRSTESSVAAQENEVVENRKTITLAVMTLQEIILEGSEWNGKKFSNLLGLLYSFCKITEIVHEIFIPFLTSDLYSLAYLKCILLELQKIISKFNSQISIRLIRVLENKAIELFRMCHVSKFAVDEPLTFILSIMDHQLKFFDDYVPVNYYYYYGIVLFNSTIPSESVLLKRFDFHRTLFQRRVEHTMNTTANSLLLHRDDIMRYLIIKSTKKQYLEYANEIIKSQGAILNCKGLSESCDEIIRLTFEACLLCLEFPEIAPCDIVGFLLNSLVQLLSLVQPSKKERAQFCSALCKSLTDRAIILRSSVERAPIAEAYSELIKSCEESSGDQQACITAVQRFSQLCTRECEKLSSFDGPHSPFAIKYYLTHNIMTANLDDYGNMEKHMVRLDEYLEFSS